MRKLASFLFLLCLPLLLSNCEASEVISIDDSGDDKTETTAVVGFKRSSDVDVEEGQTKGRVPTNLLLSCGHRCDPISINDQFISNEEMENYKCASCGEEVSYESFAMNVINNDRVPENLTCVESRLSVPQMQNLARFAIKEPSGRVINNLIKFKFPFINLIIQDGAPALLYAGRYGSIEVNTIILNSDIYSNLTYKRRIALCFFSSVFHLNYTLAEHLLALNKNYLRNVCDQHGIIGLIIECKCLSTNKTAFFYSEKHIEAIDWLVEKKGFSVNSIFESTKTKTKRPIIHTAIFYNDARAIRYLIEHDVDLNIKHEEAHVPLVFAARYGKTEAIKVLLEYPSKVAIDQVTTDGCNAFHAAIINGHIETVNLFFSIGFSLLTSNKTTSYVLHRVTLAKYSSLLELLLKKGANPLEIIDSYSYDRYLSNNEHYKTNFFRTDPAIVLAIIDNNVDIVEIFLKQKLSPNTRIANNGSSLLHLACQLNRIEIAKLLVSYNADTSAVDRNDHNAFSYASKEFIDQIYANLIWNLEI